MRNFYAEYNLRNYLFVFPQFMDYNLPMLISDLISRWADWEKKHTGSEPSRKVLAARSGLSYSYLSDIIHGRRLNALDETASLLAKAFNVEPLEFLAGPEKAFHREADMSKNSLFGELVRMESELNEDELSETIKYVRYQLHEARSKKNIFRTSQL